MRNNQVAILDIGSSKITASIGERGVNKTFIIKGYSEINYEGFSDGVFFDLDELKKGIKTLIENIKTESKSQIDKIYVGVPGEFTKVVNKTCQISFNKKKKIVEEDVNALYDDNFKESNGKATLINRSSIYFEIDGYRRLADPVGQVSQVLKGRLSYILCDNYFVDAISSILNSLNIKKVEYVSSELAEALYFFEPEERDRTCLLLDVGYISTTFTIVQGDGIAYKQTFAYGGGYIVADLVQAFEIEPEIAEKLKRKVNLSLSTDRNDIYELDGGDYGFLVKDVNSAVLYSLDELCESVENAINQSKIEIPEYIPLSLTGGGISYIRGSKEHLSKRLNMVVNDVVSKIPYMNKPSQSSYLALMDLALEQVPKKKGFFQKLFS